jgi:hypothetical protein
MNQSEIAALLLSILAAMPAAFAKDQAPSTSAGASGVELTQALPKPPAPPAREAVPDPEADARHCLEFPTNLQIIMCAEKYRSHKRIP